jgi:hypothetical protein
MFLIFQKGDKIMSDIQNKRICQPQLLNNNFLNFIPLICSIMVVQIHSYAIGDLSKTSLPSLIISFVSHGLCTAAVPTFFFVSGYQFFRNIDHLSQVFQKQKNRCITVLLPFIVWSTIYFLLWAIGANIIPNLNAQVDTSFGGIIKGIIFYQYCFPLWYMFQLCVFISLSLLIFYSLRNKYISIILFVISAAIGLFCENITKIYIGSLERELFQFNFFAYYLLGCILAKSPKLVSALLKLTQKTNIVIPIIFITLFGFLESLIFEEIIPSFNNRCIVPFVFASFFLLSLKISQIKTILPKPKVSTMIIYAIHPAVGLFLGELIFSHIPLPVVPMYFLSFLSTLIFSFVIGYIIKLLKPIYFILSGNR